MNDSGGDTGIVEGETSPTCLWIAWVASKAPPHLRLPLCVYPETLALSNLCPTCASPSVSSHFQKTSFSVCFSTLFLSQNKAIQTGKWTIIYRKAGSEREEAWTGVDMWNKGGNYCCIWGGKLKSSCLDVIKNMCWDVWRKQGEILPAPSPPVVFCVAAVGEEWLDSGVQDMLGCKCHHLHNVKLKNIYF